MNGDIENGQLSKEEIVTGLIYNSDTREKPPKPTGCCGEYQQSCRALLAECGKVKHTLAEVNCRESCGNCCSTEKVKGLFPMVKWVPKYRLEHLQGDIIAGLTVGLTVIPQGLAYAVIADLPPQYGLYSAYICCFIYCIFGTSKDINYGPTAVMSLLTATFCQYRHYSDDLKDTERQELQAYFGPIMAIVLALFSGIIQLAMAVLRIGFVTDFISHPVINSFTTAAAITILCSQLKKWLGLSNIPRDFILQLIGICQNLPKTKYGDAILGIVCMILLYLMKRAKEIKWGDNKKNVCKKIMKKSLWLISIGRNAIVITFATALMYCLDRYSNIDEVTDIFSLTGKIPSGLPFPSIPKFSGEYNLSSLTSSDDNITTTTTSIPRIYSLTTKQLFADIGPGFVVAPLIGIIETIAIGKAFARINKYKIDANQELIAIGSSNLMGCFFSAYPITASFSRSAVNGQSGVRTTAGAILTGLLVIIALVFLTPMFYFIPQAALAAVIMMAVTDIIDFSLVPALWRVKRVELIPWFVTFILSLLLAIEYGILAGVGVSLCILLIPWNRPKIQESKENMQEGLLKLDTSKSSPEDAIVISINQGLWFPGNDFLWQRIMCLSETANGDRRSVVLDMQHVATLDFSAGHVLEELVHEFHDTCKRELVFCNCNEEVLHVLRAQDVNRIRVYASSEHALYALKQNVQESSVDLVVTEATHLCIE